MGTRTASHSRMGKTLVSWVAWANPSGDPRQRRRLSVLCSSLLFQHAGKHCAFSERRQLCIVPPTTANLGKSEEVARCTAGRAGEAGRPWACERVGKSAAAPAVRSPSAEVEKRRRCASKVSWNLTQKSVSYFRDFHLFNDPHGRGSFYVYIRSTRSPEQLAVHYASCTEI